MCTPHPANFVFLVKKGFLHVGQAGLELLTSGDLPTSTSQSARITGLRNGAQPTFTPEVTTAQLGCYDRNAKKIKYVILFCFETLKLGLSFNNNFGKMLNLKILYCQKMLTII